MTVEPRTHLQINPELCGEPRELGDGHATVVLETSDAMRVDRQGLVHGGFVFGLADYAAMLAVNDPNVVLGAAESRFLAPVAVGQEVVATAKIIESKGKKRVVEASAEAGGEPIFEATFTTFVLDAHVLDA